LSLHDTGDDVEAQRYLDLGIRLCQETGNRWDEAWGIHQLATLYFDQGDLAAALSHFQRVVALASETLSPLVEKHALFGIGRVFWDLGQHTEALAYYERALSAARQAGRQHTEGIVLCFLSVFAHCVGENDQARAWAQESLHVSQTLGSIVRSFAWSVLGDALAGLGDLDGAGDAHRRALQSGRALREYHRIRCRPGPVRVALLRGGATELREALPQVETMLRYWEMHPTLQGVLLWPFQVCWTCYRLLERIRDPRAPEVLSRAYHLMQARAAALKDPAHRRAFLQEVQVNREIVAEYERYGARCTRSTVRPDGG
jgi:tetratricopeptide (TPR) repeat protein